jgi:hypothetical protein
VQLVQVIDPATPGDPDLGPDPGKRFVATSFKITNTGKTALQDDANNNTTVIGTDNQSYPPDFDEISECTNFNDGSYSLGPGESVNGCVVFEMPSAVKVAKVQWTPNSSFSSTFAEWLNP